eukprot:3907864-Rhodomonas_salina.3
MGGWEDGRTGTCSLYMPKMVPTGMLQSMLELPSRGSKTVTNLSVKCAGTDFRLLRAPPPTRKPSLSSAPRCAKCERRSSHTDLGSCRRPYGSMGGPPPRMRLCRQCQWWSAPSSERHLQ